MKISEPQPANDGTRLEDIKSKLERYRREREELEKIRNKFSSKSQERQQSQNGTQMMHTTMLSRNHALDKENMSSEMPKMNQTMQSTDVYHESLLV